MAGTDVLVVGAGVVGAAVAHRLTLLGLDRVTVVDARGREALPGSTGLAPGFVGQLSAVPELAVLAMDSVATWRELSRAAPSPLFRQTGCLEVATGAARLAQAHRDVEHGRALGIEARVLDAAEAVALAPALVDADRAVGALHVPSDGVADPVGLTHALVASAEARGARFRWHTAVRGLETDRGHVVGVHTAGGGRLRAAHVVLAAGVWGPVLAAGVGVRLPMVGVQHPYVFTEEVDGLDDTPVDGPFVRYPDQAVYTRRHGRRYGLGTYAHAPVPWSPPARGLPPGSAASAFREEDFAGALAAAAELVPAFRKAAPARRINGAFALTPDELPLVGPAAGTPGLWIAEASWVTHAGGIARHLATMLLRTGDYLVDPVRLSPQRFGTWTDTRIRETSLGHYRGIYDTH